MTTEAGRFFQTAFESCGGFIEIRLLPSRRQRFFRVEKAAEGAAWAVRQRGHVYFGVATRDGKGGGKDNIVSIPAVWSDVDFKTTPREELRETARRLPFRPSLVVSTGGGFHLYWLLRKPAAREDLPTVEAVNRRLAELVGGDLAACDAARVLRVPVTTNPKYSPPPAVRVVQERGFRYNLEDLAEALQIEAAAPANAAPKRNPRGWLEAALKGVEEGRRDATGAKICGYFIEKLPAEDILSILRAWNAHNQPPLPDAALKKILRSIGRYRGEPKNAKPKITLSFN